MSLVKDRCAAGQQDPPPKPKGAEMANLCQPCGRRHVAPETYRIIWMENFYLEWDKDCPNGCGDTQSETITNSVTGEVRTLSPNEIWVLFGGTEDQVGLMTG